MTLPEMKSVPRPVTSTARSATPNPYLDVVARARKELPEGEAAQFDMPLGETKVGKGDPYYPDVNLAERLLREAGIAADCSVRIQTVVNEKKKIATVTWWTRDKITRPRKTEDTPAS